MLNKQPSSSEVWQKFCNVKSKKRWAELSTGNNKDLFVAQIIIERWIVSEKEIKALRDENSHLFFQRESLVAPKKEHTTAEWMVPSTPSLLVVGSFEACKPCQQAHAACNNHRPCSMCVELGIANECRSAPVVARRKRTPQEDRPTAS